MRRTAGFVIGAVGLLALALFFLAPSMIGERAGLAEMADYGSAATSSSRGIFLIVGVALLALGGAMTRR